MHLTEEQLMTTRKKYSKEFKLDAVSLVLEQGFM
jgi:transposase-like protein